MNSKNTESIDEYISNYPDEIKEILNKIREVIKKAAPEASEKISYQMPTFYLNGNLVHFAVHTRHIGFYPAPEAIEVFKEELTPYKCSKGAIQFKLNEPIPYELIEKITKYRAEENKNKKRAD